MSNVIDATDFTAPDIIKAINNNENYLKKADRKYCQYLLDYGIDPASVDDSVLDDDVRECLVSYVSMLVASANKGYTLRQAVDGVETDNYKVKYDDYRAEWKEFEKQLSFDKLLLRAPMGGTASGQIFRG